MFDLCGTQSTACVSQLEQVSCVLCQASWGRKARGLWNRQRSCSTKRVLSTRHWFQVPGKTSLDVFPYTNIANTQHSKKSDFPHSSNVKKGRKLQETWGKRYPYRVPNKPLALSHSCSEKNMYGTLHSYQLSLAPCQKRFTSFLPSPFTFQGLQIILSPFKFFPILQILLDMYSFITYYLAFTTSSWCLCTPIQFLSGFKFEKKLSSMFYQSFRLEWKHHEVT